MNENKCNCLNRSFWWTSPNPKSIFECEKGRGAGSTQIMFFSTISITTVCSFSSGVWRTVFLSFVWQWLFRILWSNDVSRHCHTVFCFCCFIWKTSIKASFNIVFKHNIILILIRWVNSIWLQPRPCTAFWSHSCDRENKNLLTLGL